MLTLSLIIPVYNEERHIRTCLDAVAAQTVMPDEVIVVDNNCSDRTIEIAKEYDFVTVIAEKKQGRSHARAAGFDAAHGDILGRIDADSRVDRDWVEVVKKNFDQDPEVAGLTGLGKTAFLPGINFIKSTLASRVYYWIVHASFNTITMWGANMAIRRSAWQSVSEKVQDVDLGIHEDQDISLWLAAEGLKINQNNHMFIRTNGQGYRYLAKLIKYSFMFKKTRLLHKRNGNLTSQKVHRLGFWNTLPGRLGAMVLSVVVAPILIVLFPIDYVVHRLWPKSWWLD